MSRITNNGDITELKKLLKTVERMRQNIISTYVESCIQKQEIPEVREQLRENKDKIINGFVCIFKKIPGGNHVAVLPAELDILFPKIFDDFRKFFKVFDMELIEETENTYELVANFIAKLY